jgi:hypothetical protein
LIKFVNTTTIVFSQTLQLAKKMLKEYIKTALKKRDAKINMYSSWLMMVSNHERKVLKQVACTISFQELFLANACEIEGYEHINQISNVATHL